MGVNEGNIQVMDIEMKMENCSITIPTVHTYKQHLWCGLLAAKIPRL